MVVILIVGGLLFPGPAQAAFVGPPEGAAIAAGVTLTVNTTDDASGLCTPAQCTLRQAIETANSVSGADMIAFDIPGPGPHTITWMTELPTITDPVTIDGTTQPGFAGSPIVRIDPPNGSLFLGLNLTVGNNTVLGLEIVGEPYGIRISGSSNTIGRPGAGNVISGNAGMGAGIGVEIVGDGNLVQNNQITGAYVGLRLTGSDSRIGGTGLDTGNALEASNGTALQLTGDRNITEGNSVEGSYPALALTGSDNTIGGSLAAASNQINSGGTGTSITGDRNEVRGNSVQSGSGSISVNVSGSANSIVSNRVQGSFYGPGIRVGSGTGNAILSNIIPVGVAIRLGNGTTNDPGDADTGPNNLQNFPVLNYAQNGATDTTVGGTLNSEPNKTYTLEFFTSTFHDSFTPCAGSAAYSEHGGAERLLGSHQVTTDANGDASFTATLPTTIPSGDWVTATATDPDNNTSEFAKCRREGLADLSVTKTDSPDPVAVGATLTYDLSVHNAGPSAVEQISVVDELPSDPPVTFVQATSTQASCSHSGGIVRCSIDTLGAGNTVAIEIVVTPSQGGTLTNQARLEPEAFGTPGDPDATNNSDVETTVVVSANGYARPKAATPSAIRLVPAFRACTTANGSHGAPLIAASCNPPQQASDHLTVGSPDANGQTANSTGFILFKVVGENPINPNNGDQANVNITFQLSDVRRKSDLLDYSGQLRVVLALRITDRYNGPSLDIPATTIDASFPFTVGCSPTGPPSNTAIGSNCNLATTADAVMADSVREGKRSIWGLGQVQVFDGGVDGQASTTGDNTLFAVQGTYVP